MRVKRYALGVLLAALVAVGAGCGRASQSSGSFGESAQSMPADSLAYLDVNLDQGSAAWTQLDELATKFPAWKSWVSEFNKSANSGDVSLNELKPLLGGDAGFAVTGFETSSSKPGVSYVAAISITSDSKVADELTSHGGKKNGSYEGFDLYKNGAGDVAAVGSKTLLVASSEDQLRTAIDTNGGGDSLADDSSYKAARAEAPDASLAIGYVNPSKFAPLLALAGGMGGDPGTKNLAESLASTQWASVWLAPRDSGIGLGAAIKHTDGNGPTGLPETNPAAGLPADTLAYLAESGLGGLGGVLSGQAGMSGVPVNKADQAMLAELTNLLAGDSVLSVRPGLPVSVALVLHPADPAKGEEQVQKLLKQATIQTPGLGMQGGALVIPEANIKVTTERKGDMLVIGNDPTAGTTPDQPLSQSDRYASLLSAAGAPSDATVPFYLDLHGLLGLVPVSQDRNLQALDGAIVWVKPDGDITRGGVFLAVR
jgi:hypothetical protein